MRIKDIPTATKLDIFDHALTENGIVAIHAIDQPLATAVSDIIGGLHRMLEARGMTAEEIRHELELQLR